MSDLFEEILKLEPDDDPDSLQTVTYRLSKIKTTSDEVGATIMGALGFLIQLREKQNEMKKFFDGFDGTEFDQEAHLT